MFCPYKYRDGDPAVVSGKKQIGEVCNNHRGIEKWQGHCAAHARMLGLMSEEDRQRETERRADGQAESRKRKDDAIVAAASSETLNQRVLEALNFKDEVDLAEEYAMFCATPGNKTQVDYNEKMAFARWHNAPAHLKNPQTLEEAGQILGRTTKTLLLWKTDPLVIDFINSDMEKRALGLFPLAIYKLGANIDKGDRNSIALMMEYYEKKSAEGKKVRRGLELPPEMQKEADDYTRAVGEMSKTQALGAEKNMVVDAYFNPPTETE